jgi:ferrous iron transport protein B
VIDRGLLSRELGMPVLETVGVRHDGAHELLAFLDLADPRQVPAVWPPPSTPPPWHASDVAQVIATQQEVRRILAVAVSEPPDSLHTDDAIDRVVLASVVGHVVAGRDPVPDVPGGVQPGHRAHGVDQGGRGCAGQPHPPGLPPGVLQSLLVDGILAGTGGVLVFLPQILILFFFIIALEDSGYLPRAAFLLDRVMGTVGLSGRSFIPLLSSFACAIPGIMATRTISHWRDRLVTIMIAPLMTCSARLPVYALLIGAFIPARTVWGLFNLQGLVLFGLYLGDCGRDGRGGGLHAPARRHATHPAADGTAFVPLAESCATWRWACTSARSSF